VQEVDRSPIFVGVAALDGGDLYYTDTFLRRMSKNGGGVSTQLPLTSGTFAFDAKSIYKHEYNGFVRYPKAGGAVTSLGFNWPGSLPATGLRGLAAGWLYVDNARVPSSGGSYQTLFPPDVRLALGTGFDANAAYFMDYSGVVAVPHLGDPTPVRVVSSVPPAWWVEWGIPGGTANDEMHRVTGGLVFRVGPNVVRADFGGGYTTLATDVVSRGLAFLGDTVYFVRWSAGSPTGFPLLRMAALGGPPELLADGFGAPEVVLADSEAVYLFVPDSNPNVQRSILWKVSPP
jgi:hypothetical protein